jgi:hypothetical protein
MAVNGSGSRITSPRVSPQEDALARASRPCRATDDPAIKGALDSVYVDLVKPDQLPRLYWNPTWGGGCWCSHNTYDLECPKCAGGMLLFQAEQDCQFGLVAADCACRFTADEAMALEEDVIGRYAERVMYP